MSRRTGTPQSLGSPVQAAPLKSTVFVEDIFQEFRNLMSGQEAAEWLMKLSELLQSTFCGPGLAAIDRSHMIRRTHAIVSLAGFLGFADLARRCSALEEACHAETELSPPFEAAKLAAQAALRTISTLE